MNLWELMKNKIKNHNRFNNDPTECILFQNVAWEKYTFSFYENGLVLHASSNDVDPYNEVMGRGR